MPHAIVVQRPATGPAPQLILLFHGVGSNAESMLPLAQRMAAEWPEAFVVSVQAPHASDLGQGWQWFSVQGITDDNRPARVAEAMPQFVQTIEHWQRESGVAAGGTALVGFSQGAIMALESTARPELLAGRIVALSGRYAQAPHQPPAQTTLHFVHGKEDAVIHYGQTVMAAQQLVAQGADLTADVLPFVGHTVSAEVQERVIERLRTHLPQHRWQEAMEAARGMG